MYIIYAATGPLIAVEHDRDKAERIANTWPGGATIRNANKSNRTSTTAEHRMNVGKRMKARELAQW